MRARLAALVLLPLGGTALLSPASAWPAGPPPQQPSQEVSLGGSSDPSPALERLAEAMARLRAGRPAEAEVLFREAVRAAPQDGRAHLGLGLALAALDRVALALPELQAAARLMPESPDAHLNLGVALGKAGHGDEGLAELERAVALQP